MNKNKLNQCKLFFKEWSGANAAFTMFTHVDSNIFIIQLSGLVKDQLADVGFRKCKYISGSVIWGKINFIIDDSGPILIVSDKQSGFYVKCEDIYIGKNLIDILT